MGLYSTQAQPDTVPPNVILLVHWVSWQLCVPLIEETLGILSGTSPLCVCVRERGEREREIDWEKSDWDRENSHIFMLQALYSLDTCTHNIWRPVEVWEARVRMWMCSQHPAVRLVGGESTWNDCPRKKVCTGPIRQTTHNIFYPR